MSDLVGWKINDATFPVKDSEARTELNELSTEVFTYAQPATDAFTIDKGAIASATGGNNTASQWLSKRRRSSNYLRVTKGTVIECDDGIDLGIYFYTAATWVNSYTGMTGFLGVPHYTIKGSDDAYVRIALKKADNSNFADDEYPTVRVTFATSRIDALEDAMETLGGTVETLGGDVETLEGAVDAASGRVDHLEIVSESTTDPTRNLCNVKIGKWYPNASGVISSVVVDNLRVGMAEYIPCEPSTDYVVSAYDRGSTTNTIFYVAWKDSNGVFIRRDNATRASSVIGWAVTSPENAAFMTFSVYNATYVSQTNTKLQIEKGIARTDYTPPYSVKDTVARDAVARMESAVETLDNTVQELQTGVDNLDNNVDYLMHTDYPDYFQESLEQAADDVCDNMLTVGVNGESFVFITDVHWGNNQKHSPALIRYILNHTNVRNVVCGGDLMDSSSNASEMSKARDFMQAMNFCPGGLKHVVGNHDYRHGSHTFASAEVYSMFYPQAEMEWKDITCGTEKIYGYFDVPATKTRYLNIGMPFGVIRSAEIPWIEDQIATHPELNIIIFAHYLYTASEDKWRPEALNLMKLCSAYSNVRAIIYGHIHADKVDYAPSGIPVISVDTDSSRLSATLNPNVYEIGTITEQAFDIMTVNHVNSDVQCVRVGRGKSRSVHGGTTLVAVEGETTFTTEMSDAVWRSSDTSVATVADGVVTGVAHGMAVICAAGEDTEEFWSVTVGDSIGTVSVAVGETAELTPIMLTEITANSWQSANADVATVEGGVVTGVAAGKTAIRAFGKQGSVANYEFWDVTVVE